MVREKILQQTIVAILAQANQQQELVLALLETKQLSVEHDDTQA